MNILYSNKIRYERYIGNKNELNKKAFVFLYFKHFRVIKKYY